MMLGPDGIKLPSKLTNISSGTDPALVQLNDTVSPSSIVTCPLGDISCPDIPACVYSYLFKVYLRTRSYLPISTVTEI